MFYNYKFNPNNKIDIDISICKVNEKIINEKISFIDKYANNNVSYSVNNSVNDNVNNSITRNVNKELYHNKKLYYKLTINNNKTYLYKEMYLTASEFKVLELAIKYNKGIISNGNITNNNNNNSNNSNNSNSNNTNSNNSNITNSDNTFNIYMDEVISLFNKGIVDIDYDNLCNVEVNELYQIALNPLFNGSDSIEKVGKNNKYKYKDKNNKLIDALSNIFKTKKIRKCFNVLSGLLVISGIMKLFK